MKFFQKTDVIIIFAVIAVSLSGLAVYRGLFSKKPAIAEIYYGTQLVKTVDLTTGTDTVFTLPQNEHVAFHLHADGSISFEESDCPDKVCIRSGKQRIVGQSAACLPNQFILKIVPKRVHDKDDIDLIVGQ